MTYQFWYDHWKNHNFASSEESTIGPVTWAELIKKFGSTMIVDGHIEGIIRVVNDFEETHITEFPPHVDPANDEKSLYRIHFEGEQFATDLRYQIIMDLNDEDLAALHKKYPTEDTFGCDSDQECEDGTKTLEVIELSTFKFWFKHWAEIDFGDDTVDEFSWEEMVEEYGEDNIKLAVEKEWISLYFGGGEVTDLPPEFDEEDREICIEVVVNGENMARASAMLKGDDTYKEDLVSVNDLYGSPYDDCDSDSEEEIENRCTECNVDMGPSNPRQLCGKTYCRTPSPKRKREEDECPPAPKKAKCQSPETYPKVYQTPAGPVTEDKNGTLTFPDGTVSEVVSIYSDSTMPGGVIDDDGCIKKDAPNLVVNEESDDEGVEDLSAENFDFCTGLPVEYEHWGP
jgi:hypothetical protein